MLNVSTNIVPKSEGFLEDNILVHSHARGRSFFCTTDQRKALLAIGYRIVNALNWVLGLFITIRQYLRVGSLMGG